MGVGIFISDLFGKLFYRALVASQPDVFDRLSAHIIQDGRHRAFAVRYLRHQPAARSGSQARSSGADELYGLVGTEPAPPARRLRCARIQQRRYAFAVLDRGRQPAPGTGYQLGKRTWRQGSLVIQHPRRAPAPPAGGTKPAQASCATPSGHHQTRTLRCWLSVRAALPATAGAARAGGTTRAAGSLRMTGRPPGSGGTPTGSSDGTPPALRAAASSPPEQPEAIAGDGPSSGRC
jgi:hypothetical protein